MVLATPGQTINSSQFIFWEHYHSFISTTKGLHYFLQGLAFNPVLGVLHQKCTCVVSPSLSTHLSRVPRKSKRKGQVSNRLL